MVDTDISVDSLVHKSYCMDEQAGLGLYCWHMACDLCRQQHANSLMWDLHCALSDETLFYKITDGVDLANAQADIKTV